MAEFKIRDKATGEVFTIREKGTESTPKSTIGGVASQAGLGALSGLSMNLLDTGNKPMSEVLSGEVGMNAMRGVSAVQNPMDVIKRFAQGGMMSAQASPQIQEPTLNSTVGFPTLPQPKGTGEQIARGLGSLAGNAVVGAGLERMGRNTPMSIKDYTPDQTVINETIRKFYDEAGKAEKISGYAEKKLKTLPKELSQKANTLHADADRALSATVDNQFKDAKTAWQAAESNNKVQLTAGDELGVVEGAIRDLKLSEKNRNFQSPGENNLLDLRNRLYGDFKPVEQQASRNFPNPELEIPNRDISIGGAKNFKNKMWAAAGGESHVEAAVMKNHAQMLDGKGVVGFTGENGVGRQYGAAFENAMLRKIMSKSNLSGVARGTITPDSPLFQDMVRADQRFGTKYTEAAQKLYGESVAKKSLFESTKKSASGKIEQSNMDVKAHQALLKYLEDQPKGIIQKVLVGVGKHYLRKPLRAMMGA
jgi:hypothetical protein